MIGGLVLALLATVLTLAAGSMTALFIFRQAAPSSLGNGAVGQWVVHDHQGDGSWAKARTAYPNRMAEP